MTVSRSQLGDGKSVDRFLHWLNNSNSLAALPWYTRFRATIDLFFYTAMRNDPEYLRIVDELGKDAVRELPDHFADLWYDMATDPRDLLGHAYQEFAMADKRRMAQYFTPDDICAFMAKMALGDLSREQFEKPGGLTICEPACGSGAMVIHVLKEVYDKFGDWGLRRTVVTMIDLDILCCRMAMVQAFLFPAIKLGGVHVFHGDTLGPLDNVKCIGSIGAGLPTTEHVRRLRNEYYAKRIRKEA